MVSDGPGSGEKRESHVFKEEHIEKLKETYSHSM